MVWWIFAAALIYSYALQLWKAHYLPGDITGTRLSFGLWVYVELLSAIILIAAPVVLLFLRWQVAIITGILAVFYLTISSLYL